MITAVITILTLLAGVFYSKYDQANKLLKKYKISKTIIALNISLNEDKWALMSQLSSIRSEKESIQAELDKIRIAKNDASRNLTLINEDLLSADLNLLKIKQTHAKKETEVINLVSKFQKQLEKGEANLINLRLEVETLKEEKKQAQNDFQPYRRELTKLKEEKNNIKAEKESIQAELDKILIAKSDASQNLTFINEGLQDANLNLLKVNQSSAKRETELKNLISKISKNQKQLEIGEVDLDNLKLKLESFKAENEQVLNNFQSFSEEVAELKKEKNDLINLENQVILAKSNLIEVREITQKEEIKLQESKSIIVQIQGQIQSGKNELAQIHESISSLKKQNQQAEQNLINETLSLEQETLKIKKQKENYQSELSDLSRLISEKRKHIVAEERGLVMLRPVPIDDLPPRGEVKFIGYTPNLGNVQTTKPFHYPFVSMPKKNSVIKFPRKLKEGRLGGRGYKEQAFDEKLSLYFREYSGFEFYNDRFLFIANRTRPYIPDHILIDERNNLNLFMDIEIDEPYDGMSRFCTHEEGKDDNRNLYFNDRGWIVVRFSELQVHSNILGCCKFIAEIIKSIYPAYIIHPDLEQSTLPIKENFWSKLNSQNWAKANYREGYLEIHGFKNREKVAIDPTGLIANPDDIVNGKFVISTPITIPNLITPKNSHARDSRIEFNQQLHLYKIDGNENTISGTTFIHKFFPEFDYEYWGKKKAIENCITYEQQIKRWKDEGDESARLGTELHSDIEKYFKNSTFNPHKPEFDSFLSYYDTFENVELYRTEWRIFDESLMIAGTVDTLFKKSDGTFLMIDWKRSKEIKTINPWQKGTNCCSHLDNCNFVHYCLQQNLYKRILEDNYSIVVSQMIFIQFPPNTTTYNRFVVPDMQAEITKMYEELLVMS